MFKSVEGTFRNGVIELAEVPANIHEARVLVTFFPAGNDSRVDLGSRAIDEQHAADLRRRLASFAEDWNRPEMDVYDAL